MLPPLLILLIGLISVIGLIVVLRTNAFLALITSAMIVSLLSAGPLGERIARVAEAFGRTAGNIGIVIALAAVIGKCLMDSGAADRIVRSFLRVLGEKRAALALSSSGFVLAVPVFFDTVFYLLIPLARSLWKQTRKNYMLYILAIATGGVVTHTLVPPTPGPLLMADVLKIDIGMMIIVGGLIGIPTAALGLLVSRIMNRTMDIPMRSLGGQPELEPLAESAVPGLVVSLAPVLLPVILISINTITQAMADAEHTALIRQGTIFDLEALAREATTATDPQHAHPAGRLLVESLPDELRQSLAAAGDGDYGPDVRRQLQTAVIEMADRPDLSREPAFAALELPDRANRLKRQLDKLASAERRELNWLVLEAAFPQAVRQTPRSRIASITALIGNANLALLLSAIIAMLTLVRQRGLTLRQLAATTEDALMSGGVIILITAAGGAFGSMLKHANVESTINALLQSDSGGTGMLLLLTGFGVASVLKVAQGSGTVSMITTAAMLAPVVLAIDQPQFHAVYVACAIGCGSVTGSWMNDSGFWIFARMSGLTEVETLKSWTVLLACIGVSGLAVTMLAAWLVPLV